jgi:hypothetical protein
MFTTRSLIAFSTTAILAVTGVIGVGSVAHGTVGSTPLRRCCVPSTPRVFTDCFTSSRRPSAITITCADGNLSLRHAHWKWWGPRSAGGTGILRVNDCKPSCASGHFHHYRVTDRLHRVVHHAFSRLSIRLVHPTSGVQRRQTFHIYTRSP